ncbi:FKBP-type peptidyl-prolyl cis-trans isomerase [Oleiharenicola lentus]|uniref:FKBP-type peptidyl-prolyl cis-trans isomerase n=1 Tax=Oleiharenicola lentus TaxID=2508720 RepID=UPI003F667443
MKFMSKVGAGLVSMSLLVAASAQEPVKFNVPGVTAPAAAPAATPAPKQASQPAQSAPAAQPAAAPAAPARKFSDAQVAEAYGWYLAAQVGLRQLDFSKAEVEAVARGLVASMSGTPTFNEQEMGPELGAYLGKKQEAFMVKLRYANLGEGQAFFTKLKENKSVVELPSGLRYEITKAGSGALPKAGQVVTLHFTGSLVSGQPFGSSLQPREEGGPVEPVEILLDPQRALPGLVEGLQKVAIGSKAKIYIPPSLAYGDSGDGRSIPPGATLVFDVELISVKDAPKEPAKK